MLSQKHEWIRGIKQFDGSNPTAFVVQRQDGRKQPEIMRQIPNFYYESDFCGLIQARKWLVLTDILDMTDICHHQID